MKHHYMSESTTYFAWGSMIQRCTNENCQNWFDYGGRGITVCERWFDFRNFLADMGEKPEGLTLDRIDNDRGYSPDNCRWTTYQVQAINKRATRELTSRYAGVSWDRNADAWRAQITHERRIKYLGLYMDEEQAALAYDRAALDLYGDDAYLNFPTQRTISMKVYNFVQAAQKVGSTSKELRKLADNGFIPCSLTTIKGQRRFTEKDIRAITKFINNHKENENGTD